jgi:hypothetical protein
MTAGEFTESLKKIENAVENEDWGTVKQLQQETIASLNKSGMWNEDTAKAVHRYDPKWFERMNETHKMWVDNLKAMKKRVDTERPNEENEKAMYEVREKAEKALKKQNYWNQDVKEKLDRIIVERFPKFIDSDMWKEKAKQHPYRYRRDKEKQKNLTEAQKEWIAKAKANAEIIKAGHPILKKDRNGKETKQTPAQSVKRLKAQAKHDLPKNQFDEIREEFDEIHRAIEREADDRVGRMNEKDAEDLHNTIPDEDDDEDLYQPARNEPVFELDEDLDPMPIGVSLTKHRRRPFIEKWYSRNDVDYSDSYDDYSSDWSDYSASDEEREDIPDDEDYKRTMERRDKYREYWRKKDEADKKRREAEDKEEAVEDAKEKGKVEKTAKTAAEVGSWFLPGFLGKALKIGVEWLGAGKRAWYDNEIVMPESAKGTILEPAFQVADIWYSKPKRSTYDYTADKNDETVKWLRRNKRRLRYGTGTYKRRRKNTH